MNPFFCFYGGKWRAAPHYPSPIHSTIIEPFAGAAGYSVRYFERQIILADIDPIISGVWHYLINESSESIRRLPTQITHIDDVHVCQEAKWLIGFWLNKGVTHPGKQPSKWMRNPDKGRVNTYWGEGVRDRIATQVEQIRHWRIMPQGYTAVQNQEATWFIDPPYQQSGSRYRCGSKSIDFDYLAQWCKERHGQVLVCEQEGATWLPFIPFRDIKSLEGANGKSISHEMLFVAGISLL